MSQAKEFLLNTSTKVTRKISNKLLATLPYIRIRKVCKFKKELLTPSMSCELYEAPEALFNHTAIFIKLFPVKTLLVGRIRPGRKRQGPSSRETRRCIMLTCPTSPRRQLCYLVPSLFFEVVAFHTSNSLWGLAPNHHH